MLLFKLFPLYTLLLWAGDGDGGGSGGGTSTGEGGSGEGGQGGSGDAGGGTQTGGGQSGNGATFSQADLDRIAGQTRKEALAKWAKEHGFEKVSDLENLIKAQQEADDKNKTDLQKAQADAQREKADREKAETRLYNTVLRSAFDRAAMEQVADLDLAYLAAQNAGLLNGDGGITVDVEKNSVTGLDKVIEKLLKDKPLLKKTSQATAAGTGGSEGGNTATTPTKEQDDQARRTYGIRPQRG